MNLDIWEELKKEDELAHCEECGKNMWLYWHTDSNIINGGMKRCGPCHFKSRRMVVEEVK